LRNSKLSQADRAGTISASCHLRKSVAKYNPIKKLKLKRPLRPALYGAQREATKALQKKENKS
jgi:hypothetical protein